MKRSSQPPPERTARVGFADDAYVGCDVFPVAGDAFETAGLRVDVGELDEGFKAELALAGEEGRAREGRETAAVGEEGRAREGRETAAVGEEGRTSDGDTGRREARGDEGRPANEAED